MKVNKGTGGVPPPPSIAKLALYSNLAKHSFFSPAASTEKQADRNTRGNRFYSPEWIIAVSDSSHRQSQPPDSRDGCPG